MWRRRRQSDFDAEIQTHLELEASRLRDEGLGEAEARLAARRHFGSLTAARERFYEASRWSWLGHLTRDFRYAIRSLAKGWGFTLGAGSVLALGIAANTAIFSVVNSVLLQPLSYPDADRIVSVEIFWKDRGRSSRRVSGPDFRDWQRQSTMFEVMAYHATYGEAPIVLDGHAEYANVQHVGPGFFRVFGRPASGGRLIAEKEARAPWPWWATTGRRRIFGVAPPRLAGGSSSRGRLSRFWVSQRLGSDTTIPTSGQPIGSSPAAPAAQQATTWW